jgi:DNA repair protein RecO
MYLGLYAAELIGAMIEEHDPHPGLFDRFALTLSLLSTSRVEESFVAFELDLLRETGYLPQLETCVGCGARLSERDRAYFSPARGGIACRNCESALPDRIETDIRLVRLVQGLLHHNGADSSRLPHLTTHQTHPINRLIAEHVQHTLSRALRMRDYILPRGT